MFGLSVCVKLLLSSIHYIPIEPKYTHPHILEDLTHKMDAQLPNNYIVCIYIYICFL